MAKTADSLTLANIYGGTLAPIDKVVALLEKEVSVKRVSDFAKQVEAAKKIDSENDERRNYWGSLAVWSAHRLGELIQEGQKAGKIVDRGGDRKSNRRDVRLKLTDIGVSQKQSSRAKRIASIPKETLHRVIKEATEKNVEITKSAILKYAARQPKAVSVSAATIAPDYGNFGYAEGFDEPAKLVDSFDALAGQKFGTIYADPPWQYGNQATRAATDNHYSTMTIKALCEMPVASLAEDKAHLHLWTTSGFLRDAFDVIDAWGFEYKSHFVWVKPQLGIGNYWRLSHEILLLGVRGGLTFRDKSLKSWGEFSRRQHSEKPDEVRMFIERASPGPYLELFGRKPVNGWTVFGNQIERRLFA